MNRREFFGTLVKAVATAIILPTALCAGTARGYSFVMRSSPIVAKPMKLKARWTEEAEQNLQCYYNIRAEEALTKALKNRL